MEDMVGIFLFVIAIILFGLIQFNTVHFRIDRLFAFVAVATINTCFLVLSNANLACTLAFSC